MKISRYIPLFFLLAAPAHAQDIPTPPVAAFTGDFERGDLSGWDVREAARDDSIQIVTDPVHRGRYAAKFTVREGDFVSNGNRAELTHDNGDRAGSEVWYAWSFLVPEEFPDTEWKPKLWQALGQWHDQPDKALGETWQTMPGRSPSIAIYYTSKKGESAIELWYGTYGKDAVQKIVATAPLQKGKWHDMQFHIGWSQDETGFVEAFLDGQSLINPDGENHRATGPNMWNAASPFLKVGLYRNKEITTTNSVYFDEVRAGATRAQVEIPKNEAQQ